MLKVMIVDDEVLARIGIKSLIEWQDNDFELIGECENGKQALKMAIELEPDIIITDVKMPIMNGIELIKAVKEAGLHTKFIMLSSYDEFTLVKEAMKLGAQDYILKLQMEPEELLKVLSNVRTEIEKDQSFIRKKAVVLERIEKDFTVLKDQFLKELIYGNGYSDDEISSYMEEYNIVLPPQNLICLVVQIDEASQSSVVQDAMFRSSITNIIGESVRNYGKGQVVYCDPDMYSMICSLDTYSPSDDLHDSLERMTEAMCEFIKNSMNVTISIGVSKVYRGFKFIRQAYLEAMEAMSCKFSYPEGSVIMYEEIENREAQSNRSIDKAMNELALAFKLNNTPVIKSGFDLIIDEMRSAKRLPEKYLIGNSHILIFVMNEFIKNNRLESSEIWGDSENHYFQVSKLKAVSDYIAWIEKLRDCVVDVLERNNESSTLILRAKQYVASNIESNISLTSISDHLGLSSSYFSRMFSKETGQRFIDYVTVSKVDIAKELIRSTNKKMYEISEAIGYENVYYFSRVFKKTTGMSPMDYKNGKNEGTVEVE